MTEIHAIILALDEEAHIARCINSLISQCASITVVDSGSKDNTVTIARKFGATVLINSWVNYSTQMNFAIDAVSERGGWLLRIDADEILDSDSSHTLEQAIVHAPDQVDGLLVQRRIRFLGKRIRYGGIEPSWQLRLWRNGRGRCEQRWMDEHIRVNGEVAKTGLVLTDFNLHSLTWWTAKHNSYANREAIDTLNRRHGFMFADQLKGFGASAQARRRRLLKEKLYGRLPSGFRALLYFLYRYIFRFGLLDGGRGWYFHFLQGFWYRTLVDAKIAEIEGFAAAHGVTLPEAIRERTGIDITQAQGH